ncbi:hypothetical protein QJQ45_001857 [Haematococcus lacustris]|nr:hypothetical protein QJQ45_001857 [Haematococcus lacustris]
MPNWRVFRKRDWARLGRPTDHRMSMLKCVNREASEDDTNAGDITSKPHSLHSTCRTMASQLIQHERICTSLSNAKALQRYAERIVTLGKRVRPVTAALAEHSKAAHPQPGSCSATTSLPHCGTRYAYDLAKGRLRDEREAHKVFTTLALRYRDREGGYTRVVQAGFRDRDAVPMAYIELVDREGELRPAAPPQHISPLLPLAAQAYLRQQHQLQQAQQQQQLQQ